MDFVIFPAIAEVALVIIKAHQPPVPYQTKTLRGLAIMLMYFRRTICEIIFLMIDGMIERKLDKIKLGKNFFHFAADVNINAIII